MDLDELLDEWAASPDKQPKQLLESKAKIEQPKPKTSLEDEWGDLSAKQSKVQEQEWDIISPPVTKTLSDFGSNIKQVDFRKKESFNLADDEWGDTTIEALKTALGTSIEYQAPSAKLGGQKCFILYLGGADLDHGMTQSSVAPKSCSSLRCFNCDKKVHRFLNASWQPHVDYLFVRNHNTNVP